MFVTLLLANVAASLLVCLAITLVFYLPLARLLKSRFSEEAASVWMKFALFAVFAAGISVGTRIWDIERYADPRATGAISQDLIALEVYKTVIATLQVGALLLFVLLLVLALVRLAGKKSPGG